jgi:hypothetical protein
MLYQEDDMLMQPLTNPQEAVQHVDASVRSLGAGRAVMLMESTSWNTATSGRRGCRKLTGQRTKVGATRSQEFLKTARAGTRGRRRAMARGIVNGLVWWHRATTQGGDVATSICAHGVRWIRGIGRSGLNCKNIMMENSIAGTTEFGAGENVSGLGKEIYFRWSKSVFATVVATGVKIHVLLTN